MKLLHVTAAVIRREGKILICQRPENKNCAFLWEFPGGKIEPGETGEDCIQRECREELGVEVQVAGKLTEVTHDYPAFSVHLTFYLCDILKGEPVRKEHRAIQWISPQEIPSYEFCPADRKMLDKTGARGFFC